VKLSKKHEDSMSEQIDNLISMLVRKLATVVLIRTDEQYSCQVKSVDSETEDLIQVLSLQTITQLKIRLTADDLELYKETNDIDVIKNKSSILSLIKEVQEFNSLCRQISSQLHRKLKKNFSFTLIRNEILRKMNCVFVFQQKIIQVQLLELFHDCSSDSH